MEEKNFNYKDFFELSPDLLIISDFNGFFKKVNGATTIALGYSKEELYAKPIVDFIHPDDRSDSIELRNQLNKNTPFFNFENRFITKDGDVIWLSWTARASSEKQYIYSIAKDISYRKTIELDRNLLIADLKEKNQSYEKLTYTTAHDLRSPVDSLLSIFKMFDMSSIKDEDNKTLMEVLHRGSQQLKKKLNEYIDNLKSNHSIKVELEKVNFSQTLEAVKNDIHNLIKTTKAKISTDFSKAPTVTFNSEYLHSIFLNLISNAIKYAQPNSPPDITIYSEETDDKIKLHVIDKGIGFDSKKAKGRIFGLHQTFHENTDSKGIGLYLVHTHISSFGGNIEVESEINKGTRFSLTFNKIFT